MTSLESIRVLYLMPGPVVQHNLCFWGFLNFVPETLESLQNHKFVCDIFKDFKD